LSDFRFVSGTGRDLQLITAEREYGATYVDEGVVHYCVTNMPGAVARTSTFALNNATLPFVMALADKGWRQALQDDVYLRRGLNIHAGAVTFAAVATDLGLPFVPVERALA